MPTDSADNLKPKPRVSARVSELLDDRHGVLPVWVRAPKAGPEYFSGFSRSKLYQLDSQHKIHSRSIRQPGQTRGVRLFNLASILAFIESCDGKEVSRHEFST